MNREKFLEDEIRDEYLVESKFKHIWMIEIDILKEIIRICEKYSLSYFVYGGTLLGAVRHQGYIPWDDDMDIAMLRDDYEVFLEKADMELDCERFFLQKSEIMGTVYEGFSRIHDNHSTAIIRKNRNKDCNHGIFIDIFPLDFLPDNLNKRRKQIKKIKFLSGLIYYYVYADEKVRYSNVQKLMKLFPKTIWKSIIYKLKKECVRYNDQKGEKVAILSCDPNDEKCYWYWEDIKETIELPFEYLMVKVPKGYDRCLKIGFGNYMEFPPKEERGKWHENEIYYDPYKEYTEYRDKNKLFN
ncbi:LicD family protein [bacterium 1XD21-13]|nr:LicD family protein [bacterium 1XD21-13]